MGADLIWVSVPLEVTKEQAQENVKMMCKNVPDDVLDMMDSLCVVTDVDIEEISEVEKFLSELVDTVYSEDFQTRRDVGWEAYNGIRYLVTGGMSYGDSPTDAYDILSPVLEFDLTRKDVWWKKDLDTDTSEG